MNKSIEEAKSAVKNYLESTNRPYSSNDIFNNLQNKFSKAAIVKSLDSLVESSEVSERVNGKQKIYFLSQEKFKFDEQNLKDMDEKLEQFNIEKNELKESISIKEQKIKALKEHVPLEKFEEQIKVVDEQVSELKTKLESIDEKCKNIDPEVHLKIKNNHELLVTEWKKRKRLASQVIDLIMENYPKSKKMFLEEVGIETDEDVSAQVPN